MTESEGLDRKLNERKYSLAYPVIILQIRKPFLFSQNFSLLGKIIKEDHSFNPNGSGLRVVGKNMHIISHRCLCIKNPLFKKMEIWKQSKTYALIINMVTILFYYGRFLLLMGKIPTLILEVKKKRNIKKTCSFSCACTYRKK